MRQRVANDLIEDINDMLFVKPKQLHKTSYLHCSRDKHYVNHGVCETCKKAKSKKGCADYNEYLYKGEGL